MKLSQRNRVILSVISLVFAGIATAVRQDYIATFFCTAVGLLAGNGYIKHMKDRL